MDNCNCSWSDVSASTWCSSHQSSTMQRDLLRTLLLLHVLGCGQGTHDPGAVGALPPLSPRGSSPSALYATFSAPDTVPSFPTQVPAFLWHMVFLAVSILQSEVRRHFAHERSFLTPVPRLDDLFLVNPLQLPLDSPYHGWKSTLLFLQFLISDSSPLYRESKDHTWLFFKGGGREAGSPCIPRWASNLHSGTLYVQTYTYYLHIVRYKYYWYKYSVSLKK